MIRLLTVLLLCAGPARAVSFEEAGARFAAGDFAAAAAGYEALIASEGPSAARLFNLGNARYRAGQHGMAILAYERARLLAPRDASIAANLQLVRQAAKTVESPAPWGESLLQAASLHEWSWLTLGSALLAAAASLAAGGFGPWRPAVKTGLRAGIIAGLAMAFTGGSVLWLRRHETAFAIITASDPALKISPFPEAAEAGKPGTGRRVIPGARRNGWVYLTVPQSTAAGWLPESSIARIIP